MIFNIKYTVGKHIFGIQMLGAMFIFALIAATGV